jgi:hypothetical protein
MTAPDFLTADIARRRAARAAAAQARASQADNPDTPALPDPQITIKERLSPLQPRLAAALAKLPQELKDNGLALDFIKTLAVGRAGGAPSQHHLSQALHALGWRRRRCFNALEPSVTLWFPVTVAAGLSPRREDTPPSPAAKCPPAPSATCPTTKD